MMVASHDCACDSEQCVHHDDLQCCRGLSLRGVHSLESSVDKLSNHPSRHNAMQPAENAVKCTAAWQHCMINGAHVWQSTLPLMGSHLYWRVAWVRCKRTTWAAHSHRGTMLECMQLHDLTCDL
jgi:hypothetical protein